MAFVHDRSLLQVRSTTDFSHVPSSDGVPYTHKSLTLAVYTLEKEKTENKGLHDEYPAVKARRELLRTVFQLIFM